MNKNHTLIILFIGLPLMVFSQRALRITQLENGLGTTLSAFYIQTLDSTNNLQTSDLTNAGLGEAVINHNYARAESYFHEVFDEQDTNVNSPAYGLLKWSILDNGVLDSNAIEFATEAIAPLYYYCGDSISSSFRAYMKVHLEASLAALKGNNVDVSYTNIFLKKTVNMLLIAQILNDGDDVGYAQGLLNQWVAYTKVYGIAEYDAPTYYYEDLTPLNYGYIYFKDTAYIPIFQAQLLKFWTDMCANFFQSANNSLAGPHSRDYNFLYGGGAVNNNLFIEGLNSNVKVVDSPALNVIHVIIASSVATGYIPDSATLNLPNIPERVILSTSDSSTASCRYNFITNNFAIGSTSQNYVSDYDDKLINLVLTNTQKFPDITIVPDTFNSPYGLVETAFGDHLKPSHQPLYPACVQNKGALLVSLALSPDYPTTVSSFATNIILPRFADSIICNGQLVNTTALFQNPEPANTVISVKSGQACVAIRVFSVDSLLGQPPSCYLQMDSTGMANGALRFTIYHYNGTPVMMNQSLLKVGIFMDAETCNSPWDFSTLMNNVGQMNFNQSGENGVWNISTSINGDTFQLSRNTTTTQREPISRLVNGNEMPCSVFEVDTITDTLTSAITAINSSLNSTTQIFPNPNNGTFTISCGNLEPDKLPVQLNIYNMLGQVIYTSGIYSNTSQINLPDPVQGAYLCRITAKDGGVIGSNKFILE